MVIVVAVVADPAITSILNIIVAGFNSFTSAMVIVIVLYRAFGISSEVYLHNKKAIMSYIAYLSL